MDWWWRGAVTYPTLPFSTHHEPSLRPCLQTTFSLLHLYALQACLSFSSHSPTSHIFCHHASPACTLLHLSPPACMPTFPTPPSLYYGKTVPLNLLKQPAPFTYYHTYTRLPHFTRTAIINISPVLHLYTCWAALTRYLGPLLHPAYWLLCDFLFGCANVVPLPPSLLQHFSLSWRGATRVLRTTLPLPLLTRCGVMSTRGTLSRFILLMCASNNVCLLPVVNDPLHAFVPPTYGMSFMAGELDFLAWKEVRHVAYALLVSACRASFSGLPLSFTLYLPCVAAARGVPVPLLSTAAGRHHTAPEL